jgi:Raf kinase inhibitor-like YbhB/YbcL family protein
MSLTVKSPTIVEGHAIPVAHTEDGEDLSPGLTWTGASKAVVSFALIVDDPDAPGDEEWVHWILVNLPGNLAALPAGFHEGNFPADAPEGLIQGTNSWGTVGYRGPAPPKGHGLHHYHFKLYALDAKLAVPLGIKKHDLLEMLSGHILARGELVGTYRRD